MTTQRFGLLRAALFSVDDAARMVAEEDFTDPIARTAITLASGPYVLGDVAKKQKARDSVLRYLARMGGRATPYGLFAGTAPVTVGDQRDLELADPGRHQVRVRIDLAALDSAVTEAVQRCELARTPLRRTPSVRVEGETVRYAKPGDASADVVSMRLTPVIAEVLRLLENRTLLGAELIDGLRQWNEHVPADQLTGFLDQLIHKGLLGKAIDLVEPGVEPAEHAVALLDRIGERERAAALRTLADEATGVRPLDERLPETLHAAWTKAAETIPAFAEIKQAQRFDLQLELAASNATLDERTVHELEQAIARVATISSRGGAVSTSDNAPGPFDMAQFKAAFAARYEDAEAPLLSAVDLESGVLKSWHRTVSNLAATAGVRADGEPAPQPVNPALLEIFDRWQRDGGPVDIADVEPAAQTGARAALAVTLDQYQGRFRSMLVGGVGRAPLALLARFALGREDLQEQITAWLAEQDEDHGEQAAIHAELVYHPGGRIGNVLVRPKVLDEAIALTGAAGGTLSLDRLTIQLRGEEFRLRDTVTGRPVLVELNTAHNVDFIGLDPVYAVLGHLASSGGVGWSWGALACLSHLPRITCGPVIVSPEQWRLSTSDIEAVLADEAPAAALRTALRGFDGRRWVGVGAYDNVLPIDLDSSVSVRAALKKETLHKETDSVQLVEMPQLEAPGVPGPTGGHVAEVVLPLGPAKRTPPRAGTGSDEFGIARGKSWVYARYYCGQAAADVVVRRARQLATALSEEDTIGDWFFLRYSDDGYHVRVRMRPTDPQRRPEVTAALDQLGTALAIEGLCSRTVLDDYVPEIARYGGAQNLRLAEELFTVSSEQIADFLAGSPSEDTRLYQTVADIMAWTEELFDAPDERIEFLRLCQGGLGVTFSKTGNPHGKFARAHDKALSGYLAQAEPDERVRKALSELDTSVRATLPEHRWGSVLGSALHLHCNRMFAFDAVRLEYLSYELALRKTRQQKAREGKAS